MSIVSTVTVYTDAEYQPTSFQELLQQEVDVPGLDSAYRHVLTAAEVAEDRRSAKLTVVTTTPHTVDLARHISVLLDTPKAAVEAYDLDGNHLATGAFDAPLTVGQQVLVQGAPWSVQSVSWPNRDPETGAVPDLSRLGEPPLLDVQHAVLAPSEPPAVIQPA